MIDKNNLNLRENVMLSQLKRTKQICNSLIIEGYDMDENKVKAVYDKKVLPLADISEVNAILNYKEAYREIIQYLRDEITLDLLLKLNKVLSRDDGFDWGVLRTSKMPIYGSSIIKDPPQKDQIIINLKAILKIENATERALNLFCYLACENIFWSRNISLALIVANKIMIENGCGIILVEEKFIGEFKSLYNAYLTSNESKDEFMQFLYDNCIDGEKVTHI